MVCCTSVTLWGTSPPHPQSPPTPVSIHLNQPGHSINDILLIPLELIQNNRHSVRKAHLIDKAVKLEPRGINKRDELNWRHSASFLPIIFCSGPAEEISKRGG